MTYIITLPWDRPPLTTNETRRLHHHALAQRVRDIHTATHYQLRRNDTITWRRQDGTQEPTTLPKLNTATSVVLVYQAADNRRRDADNISASLKPILDTLVKAGVLPDDSSKHVAMTGQRILPPDGNKRGRVWLEVTP
jgi:crossover junction endodeoxyribonuclease RusA